MRGVLLGLPNWIHRVITLSRLPLSIVLMLLFAGCTSTSAALPTPSQSAAPSASVSALPIMPVAAVPAEQLLFAGRLLICSDLPYPPQEFFDERGVPIGSDIEIGEEIGRRLQLQPTIVNSIFDTIIDAVNGGKCDIVISAQNITAEREALVSMIPYFKAGQTFVVASDNPKAIHTELDLCGKKIAAQSGTVEVQFIEGTGDYADSSLSKMCKDAGKTAIELRQVDKDDEAVEALVSGKVDAYFTDSPAGGYHVVQNLDALELSGLTLDVAVQGISVPKDRPDLRVAVGAALDSMITDGTYRAVLAKYGVADGSVAGT
jgi:polar amino acid transport system substrate-binding protein